MKQPRYLLIGNGRVAQHVQYYFSCLQLAFQTWDRKQSSETLQQKILHATHILFLISDNHIESFIAEHIKNKQTICIHFSGSLVTDLAYGAHPLMSFNHHLYPEVHYPTIPFVIDDDAPPFESLLPGIPNSHVRLSKLLKPKYHALCVLSGNFSCMLWQKMFMGLKQELNLPANIAHPYLTQLTLNLMTDAQAALTGPLVRGDDKTIQQHLTVLEQDPFQEVYKAFVACYDKIKDTLK